MTNNIITLLTDFGRKDPYVSIMKGVILSRNPKARIIDSSHEISPQNIEEASFFLREALVFYPEYSIHIAVIDPGVGSSRGISVFNIKDRILIAPDNGLVSGCTARFGIKEAWEIMLDKDFFDLSSSFHGRDVFAPVAADLSLGIPMDEIPYLRKKDKEEVLLKTFDKEIFLRDKKLIGSVEKIDVFGNIISNISRGKALKIFGEDSCLGVDIGDKKGIKLKKNYSSSMDGSIVSIWNSSERLEIAKVNGNAFKSLDISEKEDIYLYKI